MNKVDVSFMCSYNGHNITNNGIVNLKLKARYSELVNYIQLVQMLNNDITLMIKQADQKPFSCGVFSLKELKIVDDGEALIQLKSESQSVEVNNLNLLVMDIAGSEFKAKFSAEIELEDEDDEEWSEEETEE